MIRIKNGKFTRKRHKKILNLSKSFIGSQSRLFKTSNQRIMKSLKNSYSDRRKKKSYYKKLWINRINIFCNNYNSNYNKTKKKLNNEKIKLNKKIISNLCIFDPKAILNIIAS